MHTIPEALALADEAFEAADHARAEFIYRQVLAAVPDEPRALSGLGLLACQRGQFGNAERLFRQALIVAPLEANLHNNLGQVLGSLGRPAEAAACCRRAVELAPDAAQLHNNLGVALKQTGDLDAAVDSFRQAARIEPSYADANYNLGNTLVKLHRLDEAEVCFRRAIELKPTDWEPYNNLGTQLRLLGRFDEARACFDTALERQPLAAEAHRNRALLKLLLGDYEGGWPEYEWRWQVPPIDLPRMDRPAWRGEPLAGRSVLLVAEQGLGDTIQFIRYAPLVKQQEAQVLFECPPALRSLLAGVPGVDRIVARGEPLAFDYYAPLLSLPTLFKTTLDTIPTAASYLTADPARVETWKARLAHVVGFKVGIAWQGSLDFTGDYYRSLPLENFAPLAATGATLVSLQKGPGAEQLAAVRGHWPVVELDPSFDGEGAFVDSAAVMRQLDLVITSDTSLAHLAGALGVPTWVALQYAPNWRWLTERTDSPWYPSMRLFRQRRFGDWEGVFAEIAAALSALLRGSGGL